MRDVPSSALSVPGYLRYAVAAACAVVVLSTSLADPGDGATSTLLGLPLTTYLHLVGYAGFSVTLCYAMLAADGRALFVAAGIATVYGGIVELLQGTVPYRTMEVQDGLINAIGACAGAVIWHRVAPWHGATAVVDA